ncbi:hypothetical protein EXS54_02720 [Patescibacteria group bacterium]|nr:hypothetical protein [Patescibacteria group bacterium]
MLIKGVRHLAPGIRKFLKLYAVRRTPGLRQQRGFTLIEIIVMASVATVGLLAILVVANTVLRASDSNENRVAATNLAREGIELVRGARDSNWQTYGRQQAAGATTNLQGWDCYVSTPEQAQSNPPGCGSLGTTRFGSSTSPVNFVAYPNVGNGVPYFVVNSVVNSSGTASTTKDNSSGTASTTKDNAYLICQGQGSNLPVYVPTAAASGNPCPGTTEPYYRRVTVQRGKDLDGGNYNILVKSYVTWPDNKGSDVVIEEYLTDWRKFS